MISQAYNKPISGHMRISFKESTAFLLFDWWNYSRWPWPRIPDYRINRERREMTVTGETLQSLSNIIRGTYTTRLAGKKSKLVTNVYSHDFLQCLENSNHFTTTFESLFFFPFWASSLCFATLLFNIFKYRVCFINEIRFEGSANE